MRAGALEEDPSSGGSEPAAREPGVEVRDAVLPVPHPVPDDRRLAVRVHPDLRELVDRPGLARHDPRGAEVAVAVARREADVARIAVVERLVARVPGDDRPAVAGDRGPDGLVVARVLA